MLMLLCTGLFCFPGPGAARASNVEVYLTREEAARSLFPEATGVERRLVAIKPALREEILKRIAPVRPSLWERVIPTYVLSSDHEVIGYAVIVNEIGKHRPITFVVGVEPSGKVRGVEIMMYREAVGSEVRMRRFLKQYEGKTLDSPLRTRRDITNISGATLSVRAVNRGTKKALALVDLVYRAPSRGGADITASAPE